MQLGWGFRKAFSFEPVIKTPFDLLKHLAVWQLQVSGNDSNLLIVFYVQIMPDDLVMQLHRF
ncbi:hypothetical protein D9F73_00315 [Escherichia coli]|nr:hypothetical protein AM346_06500 [Escherichia coli]EEW2541671.1 hypothetical protein [Escherichia coli]EFB9729520.1 hypothetical protein [Escherichia coli]EFO3043385.1 hypothetical protein [Escherichia coli]MGP97512.1 hypothetical protein [Escherichia coli]